MSDVWFTADTHLNHRAMVINGWRPQWTTVPDMNEALTTGWNETVKPKDIVFHLGDLGMGRDDLFLPMASALHGEKHLITGNHDKPWSGFRDAHKYHVKWLVQGRFKSIQSFARRRINGESVLLSHFPYQGDHSEEDRYGEFRLRDTGLWLLHGHVHHVWQTRRKMINVGVDVWGYKPVHVDTLAKIINDH